MQMIRPWSVGHACMAPWMGAAVPKPYKRVRMRYKTGTVAYTEEANELPCCAMARRHCHAWQPYMAATHGYPYLAVAHGTPAWLQDVCCVLRRQRTWVAGLCAGFLSHRR